jgi:DNA polymerase (family 10)
MARRNEEVARLLENIAKLLALKGENPFRVRAHSQAARNISAMSEDLEQLWHAGRLDDIPGLGPSIAGKVSEYLERGRSRYYEALKRQVQVAAADLLEVEHIGLARARVLSTQLGITSVADLEQAARAHKLCTLPGFGEKLEQKIGREAGRVAQRAGRVLLGVAVPAAEAVVEALRDHPAVHEASAAGSIRRMRETIGDVDVLAASERPQAVMAAFLALPAVKEVLAHGPTKASVLTHEDVQVDLRVVRPEAYGSALQYFTGSKEHNVALRSLAQARGWKLSEYGLFDQQDRRIAGRTEAEVYLALGLEWIPPELRENRGEIERALRARLPTLVELSDLRGDLHVHTDWSDGHDRPERMVEAAIARGYAYLAFTDHSQSLPVAGGLSIERLREQRRLIDGLNARYAPFWVLHSTEVDILPDGTLDYPDSALAELDLVTVSVHSAFDQPRERMTGRVLRALQHPSVDVLNHPTGRLLPRRSEVELDVEAVIQAAIDTGVALEIDGQPDRLDLNDVWARRAQDDGALLSCDSDAHSARQLELVRYAVATARRGWVEPRSVLNALPLERLLSHLARRRRPPRVA